MPMLLLTAADRENVIKSETCIILPKMKHRIEIVCAKEPMSTLGFANSMAAFSEVRELSSSSAPSDAIRPAT
jgi:hypothetical protein